MDAEEFRRLGHDLVERIARWLSSLPSRRVAGAASPEQVRSALQNPPMPDYGRPADELLARAAELLFEHSTFTSHPRFWGYINGCAAPLGMLGDFLASAVNQNGSSWHVSPMATEMETQAIRWIAELIGYPADADGILVSGGNAGNFVGIWAARHAKLGPEVRSRGWPPGACLYCSKETHTWIDKFADLSGLGTHAVRWLPSDAAQRLDVGALRASLAQDRAAGRRPFCVIATAGTVSTGAVDPIRALAELCWKEDLWLHVDGAYGAPAAMLPEACEDLRALARADSVALDPHKWLYVPIEAGCAFARQRGVLQQVFSHLPPYYHAFVDPASRQTRVNFNERGPQNTRGFRALKVWLALQRAGRQGYVETIRGDIAMARELHRLASERPELEAGTQSLSITTFRYAPSRLAAAGEQRLREVNESLLEALKKGGRAYVSHALVGERLFLRACVVNFRTRPADLEALVEEVCRLGRQAEAAAEASAGIHA